MELISIVNRPELLKDYIILCSKTWGSGKSDKDYIDNKLKTIINNDKEKILSIMGLVEDNNLLGFISLFKYDGDERQDLTPWYATMFVKEEYRKKGYSKLLNNAILYEAKKLGYDKIYLKTNLVNYYEKFGAKYIEDLKCGEKLYYIDLPKQKIMNIIINDNNEFLLLTMSDKDKYIKKSIKYNVTGAMEKYDKNLVDTVKRETKEELNLDLLKIEYLNWIIKYKLGNTQYMEHIFISVANDSKIKLNEEVVDYKWCSLDEYLNNIYWYSDKEILKKILIKYLNNEKYFSLEYIEEV